MSNEVDPQQLRDRIELVSEQRYRTDPVCHAWVNSGESVKVLVDFLLERSDQQQAALLKARLAESPRYVFCDAWACQLTPAIRRAESRLHRPCWAIHSTMKGNYHEDRTTSNPHSRRI